MLLILSDDVAAEKGEGVQRCTQKKENWQDDEMNIYKTESTSPTAQKFPKLGGSNKGMWKSMQQKFQTLMIYISPKF